MYIDRYILSLNYININNNNKLIKFHIFKDNFIFIASMI